ncbi:MAG: Lrp/AsnC family transcriptional regulator [Hyphomicrobiales bacterium]
MATSKDDELIALLRLNAREPIASLARKLKLSRTTVQDRLRRLETTGVIAGYGVKLGKEREHTGIKAYVEVSAEPRRTLEVQRALMKLPEIEELHTVSGKFDFVALVKTPSTAAMDDLLDRMGEIAGVTNTESAVILSTKLDRR